MSKNLMVWNRNMEIGIPVIDAEHKTLVEACNNLYKLVIDRKSVSPKVREETLKGTLKKCVDYCKYHFSHEETLMEACEYDEKMFAAHRTAHKKFTELVSQQVEKFQYDNIEASLSFLNFLYQWILSHVSQIDRLYANDIAAFLKKNPDFLEKVGGGVINLDLIK